MLTFRHLPAIIIDVVAAPRQRHGFSKMQVCGSSVVVRATGLSRWGRRFRPDSVAVFVAAQLMRHRPGGMVGSSNLSNSQLNARNAISHTGVFAWGHGSVGRQQSPKPMPRVFRSFYPARSQRIEGTRFFPVCANTAPAPAPLHRRRHHLRCQRLGNAKCTAVFCLTVGMARSPSSIAPGQHRTIRLAASTARPAARHLRCRAPIMSIICAFGLASAAPRSPYRHLELCGIALELCDAAQSVTIL